MINAMTDFDIVNGPFLDGKFPAVPLIELIFYLLGLLECG